MQYFLPFWLGDDIYERFDPCSPSKPQGRQLRVWEVEGFPRPPIDGVLVSRVNIQNANHFKKTTELEGIHKALRFNGTVMGDCGAFSYVNESKTPDAVEVLKDYKRWGFDIGVTVDHLIVKTIKISEDESHELTQQEKEERWDTSIENAKVMFDEFQGSQEYEGMRLVGVTQGWDRDSYLRGVRELLDHGFHYLGLGGLVRKPTRFITEILLAVAGEIKKRVTVKGNPSPKRKVGLHLFGVARLDLLKMMIQCGITSFDSASPLRTAWQSSSDNYMLDGDFYTAIRIRIAKGRKKTKEKRILKSLKMLDEGELSVTRFLRELESYDGKSEERNADIERTLTEKPWLKCSCPICREIGIHVCVFRGCERNMRRGFHNVNQFRTCLGQSFPRVLVLTSCTKTKTSDVGLLPAYLRYSASRQFRNFWKSVYDLPVEIGILSARYKLSSWDTMASNYDEKLTSEKLLATVEDLKRKFIFYDKIFFIGLGKYRIAVEKAREELLKERESLRSIQIEIFPKIELSGGRRLDIIEYNRQMRILSQTIKKELDPRLKSISADSGLASQDLRWIRQRDQTLLDAFQ